MGLLRGVWAEITGDPLIAVPTYTADWSEPQGDERLWHGLAERLAERCQQDAQAGDVLLFRMRQGAVAKHIGIQAEIGRCPTFIHAYQGHGVRESALSVPWQRRLVARFACPERAKQKV